VLSNYRQLARIYADKEVELIESIVKALKLYENIIFPSEQFDHNLTLAI
jgi:hypothetical protein